VIADAEEHGAAVLGVPMKATVKVRVAATVVVAADFGFPDTGALCRVRLYFVERPQGPIDATVWAWIFEKTQHCSGASTDG